MTIKNEQFRDSGQHWEQDTKRTETKQNDNIGYKIQNKDKETKNRNTTQKTNKRSNKDSIKNTRMNPCVRFEILDALYQQYFIPLCSGMTNKYNIVGTVPKQNQAVVETEAKSIPLTHI